MIYQMTTISSGTRLRTDHTTFAAMITSFNAGAVAEGREFWVAPADGSEVKKGDKWLHVTTVDGVPLARPGWMAFTHKGVPICRDWREYTETELPGEEPTPQTFPEYFILTAPDGKRARYNFQSLL